MPKKKSKLPLPRQLEAVVTVARAGSIHAASRQLGIAQPAVSRLIAATERALGQTFFTRLRSGTQLTAAGERVLKQITFALHALEDIEAVAREPFPVIRLGCIPRVMHALVPHLLDDINDGKYGFRVLITVGNSDELAAKLEDCALDYIIDRRVPGGAFDGEDLYVEKTVIVCGRNNVLIPKGVLTLAQLAKFQWVLSKRGYHSRELIDAAIQAAGQLPIVPVIEANSFESGLSMVASTPFLAVVPEFAARWFEKLKLVRVVPIRPALSSRPLSLQYRRGQKAHPAFAAFHAAVTRAARKVSSG